MEKLVTVIVPVYNTGLRLTKSVDSILQSSHRNIELLIVDDGSEKETAELCDVLREKDNRIRVIHQKNGGVSVARNTGLKNAKGDYVVFVDSDDFLEANMISSLMEIAEKENVDLVVGGYRECFDDGSEIKYGCDRKTLIKRGEEILSDFFTTHHIGWNIWGKLYRREAVESVYFAEGKKIAEDMFFVYQVLKKIDAIAIHGFPIYRYIKCDDSATADTNCGKFFDSFYLTRAVFNDPETNAAVKSEKELFYIRNELFFFRMIYVKDKTGKFRTEINEARKIFLQDIESFHVPTNLRIKLELLMLKRAPRLFMAYTKATWDKRKI